MATRMQLRKTNDQREKGVYNQPPMGYNCHRQERYTSIGQN